MSATPALCIIYGKRVSTYLFVVSETFEDTDYKYIITSRGVIFNIQGSSVSIVTRLRARRSGVSFPAEPNGFSSPKRPDPLRGSYSPQFNGCRDSFCEVKRPGFEADHLPSSSSEIKSEWSYTSTPHMMIRTTCL
jgi:hypothetical protein